MHVGRAEWVTEDTYGNSFSESAWHSLDGSGIDQYSTLSTLGSSNDSDGDSLNNEQEAWWGTDPYSPDTDGDGYTDGGEVYYTNTNPASWDYFPPPAAPDSDGDGYDDSSDPANSDSSNYSSENATYWYSDALGDADGDGLSNFYDSSPWPSTPNDDTDGDGLLNGVDPSPQDWMNYSSYNYISWYGSALEDADGDGQANYYDWSPYDTPPPSNSGESPLPPPDQDLDGIPDGNDPAPTDWANTSPFNGSSWYGYANENSDSDNFTNFYDPAPYDSGNYSYVNGTAWYGGAMDDNDNDGQANFFDSDPSPSTIVDNSTTYSMDTDGDGLTDAEESGYGTSSTMIDSDSDGLTDYEELRSYHTDPLDAYSVHNAHPTTTPNSTDFYLVDMTDQDGGFGDGIPDWVETFYGLNPNDAADAYGDLDGDGVSNYDQYQAGIPLNANVAQFDADLDGMTTVFEQHFQLNDAVFDDSVEDSDNDGLFNFEEAALVLNPRTATSRLASGTPISDWSILSASGRLLPSDVGSRVNAGDWDADGLPDAWEHRYGLESNPAGGMKIRTPDASADYDGDGVTNAEEFALGFNPLIQETHVGTNDANFDRDGDGLSDAYELRNGFDFASATGDADGDGVSDVLEFAEGTDPHDAASSSRMLIGLKVTSPIEKVSQ